MILPEYDNDIEVEVLATVHVGVLGPWDTEAAAIRRFEFHFARWEEQRAKEEEARRSERVHHQERGPHGGRG